MAMWAGFAYYSYAVTAPTSCFAHAKLAH